MTTGSSILSMSLIHILTTIQALLKFFTKYHLVSGEIPCPLLCYALILFDVVRLFVLFETYE